MPEPEHNPGNLPPDYKPPTYVVPWRSLGCSLLIGVAAIVALILIVIVIVVPLFQGRH